MSKKVFSIHQKNFTKKLKWYIIYLGDIYDKKKNIFK